MTRKIELVKSIGAEHAGAVHGHTDGVVLLEDQRAKSGRRQISGRQKTRGAGAHHNDVPAIGSQYLRPLDSHVPRKLIQKDRRIKRISSQNDCCRT